MPARIILRVINISGQHIQTLVDEVKSTGSYEVIWDGKDNKGNSVASGVYFFRIESKGLVQTRKMLLLQ